MAQSKDKSGTGAGAGRSSGGGRERPPAATDERSAALLPDLFRRALTLGLSGIFTTEEAFRRALGDTLPRDWVDFAVDQSERTRAQFVERLASEMAAVIESMDLAEVMRRVLTGHRLELKAEVRLVPEAPGEAGSAGRVRISMVGGESK